MTSCNVYEKLYNNTKSKFLIVSDNREYTLGEYMLMKAEKKNAFSKLPVKSQSQKNKAITTFFSYVNDKLTVKTPPSGDRIIRKFPFRTSAAALLSAVLVCTLVLSFGLFSGKNIAANDSINSDTEIELGEDIDLIRDADINCAE